MRYFLLVVLAAFTAGAAEIKVSEIPSTNVVNTDDLLLLESNLGGGTYTTRTVTTTNFVTQLGLGSGANWVKSGTTDSTLPGVGSAYAFTSTNRVVVGSSSVTTNQWTVFSQSADANTNVALRINTRVPWTNAFPQSFVLESEYLLIAGQADTNYFYLDPYGGLNIGINAIPWWTINASSDGISLLSLHDDASGESSANGLFVAATQDASIPAFMGTHAGIDSEGAWQGWDTKTYYHNTSNQRNMVVNTANADQAKLWIHTLYGDKTSLNPAAFELETPYILDTHTNRLSGNLLDVLNNGTSKATIDYTGLIFATTGFSSTATDAAVSIASGGWTNTFGKNAIVRFDGTAMTYKILNNAGTSIYTNAVSVGHSTEILQSGGKLLITAGSGITGYASPF